MAKDPAKKMVDWLEHSLAALTAKADAGIHIKSVRYPNYRGLAEDETLEFGFPITALIGQNGRPRSSFSP